MNRRRMKKLAEVLRETPNRYYDFGYFISKGNYVHSKNLLKHTCGTSACIAGYAAALADKKGLVEDATAYEVAKEWLDLNNEQATNLFLYNSRHKNTPKQAARAVEKMLEEKSQ